MYRHQSKKFSSTNYTIFLTLVCLAEYVLTSEPFPSPLRSRYGESKSCANKGNNNPKTGTLHCGSGLREYFWADSKVVLGYINNDARRSHVFVANQIQRIKSSTEPSQWQYVASENKPVDHASRGLTAKKLVESNWFTGPGFLWQREDPKEEEIKVGELDDGDPELKRAQVYTTKAKEERSLSDRQQRCSDWRRVVRAIARLKCRAKEAKGLKTRPNESTMLEETEDAELFVIHVVQEEAFSEEVKSRNQRKEVHENKSTKMHKLSPFMDSRDILRVGGRLTQAALHPHVKHTAILPKGHHVSRLLIKHYHEKVQHQGHYHEKVQHQGHYHEKVQHQGHYHEKVQHQGHYHEKVQHQGHYHEKVQHQGHYHEKVQHQGHYYEKVQHQGRGMTINEIRSN
ncbi:Ribosome-binding protein 1 [Merluccius polli]|uniref:Ribosome-binding protein 1 n=1 Tax=Merluccius polli TaxID=89951 RepID=A0AA47P240_MERPO|nr:Ribosome-binding protein 1 [Merluccius polli]